MYTQGKTRLELGFYEMAYIFNYLKVSYFIIISYLLANLEAGKSFMKLKMKKVHTGFEVVPWHAIIFIYT